MVLVGLLQRLPKDILRLGLEVCAQLGLSSSEHKINMCFCVTYVGNAANNVNVFYSYNVCFLLYVYVQCQNVDILTVDYFAVL